MSPSARLRALPLFAAFGAALLASGCIDYFAELPPRPDAAPDAASPDMAQPDMARPDMARPDMAQRDMAQPDAASPDMTRPDMAQPDMAQPDMAQPDMTQPDMTQPDAAPPWNCIPTNFPGTDTGEACNEQDDDCDGETDEADDLPQEQCNGLDDDCDGRTDEDLDQCRPCVPREWDDDANACNSIDDDCDGRIDEGCRPVRCVDGDGNQDIPCNGCPAGTVVPEGWVCIPAGVFVMGHETPDPCNNPDNLGGMHNSCYATPRWNVRMSRPYLMQATEVTRHEWAQFYDEQMGQDRYPHQLEAHIYPNAPRTCVNGDGQLHDLYDECPLNFVSWVMAARFANHLSQRHKLESCYLIEGCDERLAHVPCTDDANLAPLPQCSWPNVRLTSIIFQTCTGYRLPTEAEWEYAARQGEREARWPLSEQPLPDLAWYSPEPGPDRSQPRIAGSGSSNSWGLYDMYGNLDEWVTDAQGQNRYPSIAWPPGSMASASDPYYFPEGMLPQYMGVRGGNFSYDQFYVGPTQRGGHQWCARHPLQGFRLVRSLPPQPQH